MQISDRRLILAITVVVGCTFIVSATFNYMLTPMLDDLGLSQDQANLALRIPSLASILIVFLAGRLGDRLGHRRITVLMSVAFIVGSMLVMVAQGLPLLAVGLLIEGIGATGIQIVVVGLLAARFVEPKPRAAAFATYGMAYPIVYLAFPVIAGLLIEAVSWRWVAATWVLAGIAMLVVSWFLFPKHAHREPVGEAWTPILAGVFVLGIVQAVSHFDDYGLMSWLTLGSMAVAIVSFFVIRALMRRLANPSLSIAPLKHGATRILLTVVLLVPLMNTWFYITLAFEYMYGLSVLQTAIAMLPSQVAGIVGAKVLGGRLMAKQGVHRAGVLLLATLAVTMLGAFFIQGSSPIWIPIVYVSAFSLITTALTVVLITAVMNTAPAEEAGNTSAFRGSAASIGTSLGFVIMGAIVFGFGGLSLEQNLKEAGLDSSKATASVQLLQETVTSPDLSSGYALPLPVTEAVSDAEKDAMADGLHANGVAGSVIALISLGLFAYHPRRARVPHLVP